MIIDNDLIKSPKISIIITYYNLGKYIKDCIKSILNQTYQNFEIIIVNDASNSENSNILSEIQNEKIKIISLEENSGQLKAFSEGLKISDGEFICMIDADDVLLPNYLKTLLCVHLNKNIALVSSSFAEINDKNEITSLKKENIKSIHYEKIENIFNIDDELKIKDIKAPFGLWSWNPATSGMFRKTSLDIIKYYPDIKYWKTGADKVIFSLLHLIGGSCVINSIGYLYRHHNENNSQTTLTSGNKKYLTENYVKKLINWNIKLRLDTLKMFLNNKNELIKKYNKLNYFKMLLKVFFCIDIKVCAKIIKTFAFKLIRF